MTTIVRRLFEPPRGSYFLFGPRGTGKSTWLRQLHPDAHWIDLLDEARYQTYLVDPGVFAAELEALPPGSRVVVDEVQRLPNLLNTVHQKIEARGLPFALSGSSARTIRRAGTNLLGGRASWRSLHPFVPEELGDRFSIDTTLEFGALPLIAAADDPADSLAAYVRLYLKEEIQAEAATRNLAGFARFLPIAALFHAQALNVSSLAREAGVARTTVQGYLKILEDTLFTFEVPAFEARLRVRERKRPKLYWVDPGLVRAVRGESGPPDVPSVGALFEGWVAQLLRAYSDYRDLCDEIAYWQPAEAMQTEVDFILRRGSEIVAIEAKASRRWRPEFAKGLRAIAELPEVSRRIVVYLGSRTLRMDDGIDVLPLGRFLDELAAGF